MGDVRCRGCVGRIKQRIYFVRDKINAQCGSGDRQTCRQTEGWGGLTDSVCMGPTSHSGILWLYVGSILGS